MECCYFKNIDPKKKKYIDNFLHVDGSLDGGGDTKVTVDQFHPIRDSEKGDTTSCNWR